jgi:cytochrome c553
MEMKLKKATSKTNLIAVLVTFGFILYGCGTPEKKAQTSAPSNNTASIEISPETLQRVQICASCHGVEGKATIPIYPNLAGQNAEYIIGALKGYRRQDRTGGQASAMYGISSQLSDEEIIQLAAYYSNMRP